nr:PREDICTED: uncharacterized protein LOC105663152 isoform X2 [Megachile rotundata]
MDLNGTSIPGTSRGSSFEPSRKLQKMKRTLNQHDSTKMLDENSDLDSDLEGEHHGDDDDNDYTFETVDEKPMLKCPTLFTFLCVPEMTNPNLNPESAGSEPDTDPLTATSSDYNDNPSLSTNIHFDEALKVRPNANTPIDYFSLLFTRDLLQEIVYETNRFAYLPSSQISNWKKLTVDELRVFFGLFFHTGVVKILQIRYYWDKSELFNFPFFSSRMSRNRYMAILQCLHFAQDPTERETAPRDPFYKVRSIVDHFQNRMMEVYKSERRINPYEPLASWNGRIFYRSYVINKTQKRNVKMYILAENDGLVQRLLLHPGTEGKSQRDSNRGIHMLFEGLEHSNPSFLADDLYNGTTLNSSMLQEFSKKDSRLHVAVSKTTTSKGLGQEKSEGMPKLNKHVGGIDQLLSYYLTTRRRYSGDKEYYLFRYRLEVVKSLSGPPSGRLSANRIPSTSSFINSVHFPAIYPECPLKKKRRAQKLCRLCYQNKIRKYVSSYCPGCEGHPGLCISCFIQYHKENEFKVI